MNIWKILEIEPTNDKKIIKKAYAKKLKSSHPDDDPKEFQELKEAFDIALNQANYNMNKIVDEEEIVKIEEIYYSEEIEELVISEKFEDIISLEYWEEFHKKFNNSKKEELENYIFNNKLVIPKNVLKKIVDEFKLFENDEIKIKEIENIPDFKIYNIENISEEEKKQFFEIRYLIYYKLTNGFSNLEELRRHFEFVENLNGEDDDLSFLKVTFGLLEDIEFNKAEPLILRNVIKNSNYIKLKKLGISKFYKTFIDVYALGEFEKLDEEFFEFQNEKYIPDYLNVFIKGYMKYSSGDYNSAYKYWYKAETKIMPQILIDIFDKLVRAKYSYLTDKNKSEIKIEAQEIKLEKSQKNITLNELLYDYNLSSSLENWKNVLEKLNIDEYAKSHDIIVRYLVENFMLLPKNVVDYIYKKMDIEKLDEFSISGNLKEKIKKLPVFSFENDNIPENDRIEFYRKRYEYFIESTNPQNLAYANHLYNELNEVAFDYDVEIIKLQEIVLKSTLNPKEQIYSQYRRILDELKVYSKTDTYKIHELHFNATKNFELTDLEKEELSTIKSNGLVMDEGIYNFITVLIYQVIGNSSKVEEISKKVHPALVSKINPTLQGIRKIIKKKNTTIKDRIKKIAIIVSVAFTLLFLLVIAYNFIQDKVDDNLYKTIEYGQYLTESEQEYLDRYPEVTDIFATRFLMGKKNKDLEEKFIEDNFTKEATDLYKNIPNIDTPISFFDYSTISKVVYEDNSNYEIVGILDSSEIVAILKIEDEKISEVYAKGWTEVSEEEKNNFELHLLCQQTLTAKFIGMKYLPAENKEQIVENTKYYLTDNFRNNILNSEYNIVSDEFKMGYYDTISNYDDHKSYIVIFSEDRSEMIYIETDKYGRANDIFDSNSEKGKEKTKGFKKDKDFYYSKFDIK